MSKLKGLLFTALGMLAFTISANAALPTPASTALPKPASSEEPIDQIVAIVNDGIITQSQLNAAMLRMKHQLLGSRRPLPSNDVLREGVLNQLINRTLQIQIAQRVGLQVTPAEVETAIRKIANRNHVSKTELIEKIKQQGLSMKQYRNELKKQLLMNKMQNQAIAGKVNVSPEEVQAFINKAKENLSLQKQFHVYDMLIPVSDPGDDSQWQKTKAKADAIIAQLRKGADFNTIADRESGSNLGWRPLSDLPALFAPHIRHLGVNDLAGPLRAPNGYHILKLLGKRSSQQKPPTKAQAQSILLEQKYQQAVMKWIKKLRESAYIKIINS